MPADQTLAGPLTHPLPSLLGTNRRSAETRGGNWRAYTNSFPGGPVDQAPPPIRKSRATARLFPCPATPVSPETAATRSPPPQHPGPKQRQCPPRDPRSRHRSTPPANPPVLQQAAPESKPYPVGAWRPGPRVAFAFVKRYGLAPRCAQSHALWVTLLTAGPARSRVFPRT